MGKEITRGEAAEIAGVAPDTFSGYVTRGQAPRPRRKISSTSLWDEGEVKEWASNRPGQGSRSTARARRRAAERLAQEPDDG